MEAATTDTERLAARGRRAHGIGMCGCLHANPDRPRLDQFPDAGDADAGGHPPPGAGDFQERCHSLAAFQTAWINGSA
jgi:hypothetical protein